MTRNPKRRRMALPLGAGLIGALVAAFTIFAAALPASADMSGGGTFDYSFNPATLNAAANTTANVTVDLTNIVKGTTETSLQACYTITGTNAAANFGATAGNATFAPNATSVTIPVSVQAGATLGATGVVTLDATCMSGSGTDAATLATSGNVSATITVGTGNTITVTGVSPNSGMTGDAVTINGTGFSSISGAPTITFGTTTATGTVASDTQITATVPASLTPGVYSVTVNGVTLASAFTVESSSSGATLTLISPTSGPVGTMITLTGTNLTGATSVTVGGVAATNVTVVSATSVTANVPTSLTPGMYDVSIATPNGSATLSAAFEVVAATAPTLTALNPTSGGPGTTVVITGTGFTGATAVTFGGTNAAAFTVNSDTQITAVAPTGMTAGEIDVVVTTPAGSSATSAASKFDNTGNVAQQTVTITLQGRWTLVGWVGADNMTVGDALKGGPNGPANGTNDITSQVSVVWGYNSATQTWQAYFPAQANVAGANDLTTLRTGLGYFVGLVNPSTPVQWTMQYGNIDSSASASS